ncbi:MAG TPA: NADP-dependent oxidoreductase [Planctomycetota bacterium]|nr:NADP-dependent oxidoreductase [Planctomycetota bacterium]
MKAIQIHSYGNSGELKLEDVPNPSIRGNEALIRVRAAGVNPFDWKLREGYFKDWIPASFPLTLGVDFAGDIAQVGKEVSDFRVGDRVFGFASGAYSEYSTVPEKDLVHMPRTVDHDTAASLPTPGVTAYQLVLDAVRATKGLRVLVHGAAGSVGALAVQLARLQGARVFATASGRDTEYLKSLGVEQVIDYRTERFDEKLKDLDAVIDLVGGETLARSYAVLKPGGIVVSAAGTPDSAEAERRRIRAQHFVAQRDPSHLAHLARLVDQGVLKPRVGRVLPLAEARQAQDLSQKGSAGGKIVLHVA